MLLLVNDDGIDAPGYRALYRALRAASGLPVLAVAPAQERSGASHAISIDRPLLALPRREAGFFGFAVDGTPADCTKLALERLCTSAPSMVVSGINRGPNVGRSIFYSGTCGAALEAAVAGIPAMAISRQLGATADSEAEAAAFAAELVVRVLAKRQPKGSMVNLNLPATSRATWKELRLAKHRLSGFKETYTPVRATTGGTAWRLHGEWIAKAEDDDDAGALTAGHPVLTLLRPDLNADQAWLVKAMR